MSYRLIVGTTLIALIIVGFASKFYHGPLETIVERYVGGFVYVVFWFLLVRFIWPQSNRLKVVVCVLLITIIIEFSQLFSPPFLVAIRKNFIGRALIGTDFDPLDLIDYVIAAIAGALLDARLKTLLKR